MQYCQMEVTVKRTIMTLFILSLWCLLLFAQNEQNSNQLIQELNQEKAEQPRFNLEALIEHAQTGASESQYKLGKVYYLGVETEKNLNEAFKWFKAAAAQNMPEAQTALGLCYKNGEGIKADLKEALRLFNLAAAKKYAEAQFNIGVLYYNGEGVQVNNKEAVKWFKLAGEQGHYDAQANLGFCYFEGTGVPTDNAESYYWFGLASELCSEELKAEYTKAKEKAMAELAPEQVEQVDSRMTAWLNAFKQKGK